MGRILVIRGGALGDFILTLPVLSALRERLPANELHVLGYPQFALLARHGGLAEAVHPIEARALAGFFGRHTELDRATAEFFEGFDLILSYLYDPDGIFEENVRRCTRAQFVAGPHRPDESQGVHATHTFLLPLQRFGIFDADSRPRLSVAAQRPSPNLPTRIALHPGSGSAAKNWPESHWATLVAHLVRNAHAHLRIIAGEAEGDRARRLASPFPAAPIEILERRPIIEVADQLAGCHAYVGHDTGITHLAAAVGTPTSVLWGPTRLDLWRPQGENIHVLAAPGGALDQLSPDTVVDHLTAAHALPRAF